MIWSKVCNNKDFWILKAQVWVTFILVILLGYRCAENAHEISSLKAKIKLQQATPVYRIEVRECVDPWPDGDYRPLDEIRKESD